MAGRTTQRWDLTVDGRRHRVEVEGSVARTIRWYLDGDLLASTTTSDDKVVLAPEDEVGQAVGLRFSALGRARRVTLFEDGADSGARARATIGAGGVDLDPEPGSPAALREQRIREHPWRHAAIATSVGVAKVVVPLALGLLAVRFVIDLPWPSWDIPWPDIHLPRIPWPDIPWPELTLPRWDAPAWLRWLAEHVKYVWPVLLAFVLARAEVNRRRKQDALKAEMKARRAAPDGDHGTTDTDPGPTDTDPGPGATDPAPDTERD